MKLLEEDCHFLVQHATHKLNLEVTYRRKLYQKLLAHLIPTIDHNFLVNLLSFDFSLVLNDHLHHNTSYLNMHYPLQCLLRQLAQIHIQSHDMTVIRAQYLNKLLWMNFPYVLVFSNDLHMIGLHFHPQAKCYILSFL